MAGSTISLADAIDVIAAKGVPDPRNLPSGYGDKLALELGNETMADLVAGAVDANGTVTRFNWKFNRAIAAMFQLNSWQQDYPQLAQTSGPIGWGEECDILDINNTVMPKPLNWDGAMTWVKQVPRTSLSRWRPTKICWMYNSDLSFGTWPGAGVSVYPLTGSYPQNPIRSMIDANGNRLIIVGQGNILSPVGVTGSVAPLLAVNSAEGVTSTDGTVIWQVVSASSQGFRVDWLPNASSPNYALIPYFQIEPVKFANLQQLINPIPDSFSRQFLAGLEAKMYAASTNPADAKRGMSAQAAWLHGLTAMTGQGNKEQDAFSLLPITQPVERRWQNEGPRTADNPI